MLLRLTADDGLVAERGAGWEVGDAMHIPTVQLPGCGYLCVAQETEICISVTVPGEADPGATIAETCTCFE